MAFIFDMDGTLVDNILHHEIAWQRFLKNNGLDLSMAEIQEKAYGTQHEALRRFWGELTENQLIEFTYEKENLYRELYRPHLVARPGLPEFLEKTRAAGIPIALGTAGDLANVNFILDGLGIRHFFEFIVSAEDVAFGKPHPEVFLKCATGLGKLPENCLVFEDSPSGVEAARRAGMAAVAVSTDGFFPKKESFENIRRVIRSFENSETDGLLAHF